MNISKVSKKYEISQDTLRYYERVGMIPPVNRTPSGLRDYTEQDCKWVELAKCMRSAGLPVEGMIEYLKLTQQGNETISARRELLLEQREQLLAQKAAIESTLDRLNFKIGRYEKAMETGVLSWDDDEA
ncbi:MAG: MerR family transcriptional regulator [Firmicutes bacterium HGW-Firmicutes-15]|nr:MAG: MerR family transcriptional regulator [Firmicutes bacterium HGW-Firmicutes-15]